MQAIGYLNLHDNSQMRVTAVILCLINHYRGRGLLCGGKGEFIGDVFRMAIRGLYGYLLWAIRN